MSARFCVKLGLTRGWRSLDDFSWISVLEYVCIYMCVHEHTQAFAAVFRCRGSKYKQLCEVLYGKDICG